MWQRKLSGILGMWLLVMAFLGFSYTLNYYLLILTGVVIAAVNFWGKSVKEINRTEEKPNEKNI